MEAAPMIALRERHGKDADHRFAEPPWDEHTSRWQEIDRCLPADHLARQIADSIEELDLAGLFATYTGRGSRALWPDLLLRLVLYEMQRGRQSPAEWFLDAQESEPLQWLLFGMKPSRTALYEFLDRLENFWDDWNQQTLRRAQSQGQTLGNRAALDGTLIAALASRHRMVNQKTLADRLEKLQQAVAANESGQAGEAAPAWMAKHPETQEEQLRRYRRARLRMDQLQAENAKRKKSKRKKPEKIVISASEPESMPGRDKLKTFRPLYNVQLMYDLDSAFITAYELFACQNDAGTIGAMLERSMELVGQKPLVVLADAAYAGGDDVALCEQAGVTLYAPVGENDFSEAKRKGKRNPQIPKREFQWLPEEQAYCCPEGRKLITKRTVRVARANDRTVLQTTYQCAASDCGSCLRREACAPLSGRGRSVSRLEHEDLVDALRARMETAEAKELYKQRSQTIELRYADLKAHRRLRRFNHYGPRRTRAQIGAAILAYNLLILQKNRQGVKFPAEPMKIPEKVPP
jgi:transposase